MGRGELATCVLHRAGDIGLERESQIYCGTTKRIGWRGLVLDGRSLREPESRCRTYVLLSHNISRQYFAMLKGRLWSGRVGVCWVPAV